jgi:AcrR family transcriptional regulator
MSKNYADPRVRRTRLALQSAMKELVQERAFDAITISDLTAQAGVNRATFYQHFRDKDALLASIVADLVGVMTIEATQFVSEVPDYRTPFPPSFLVALFIRVEQESDFYRRVLGPGGSAFFREQMIAYLEQMIATHLTRLPPTVPITRNTPGVPPTLAARLLASGLLGVLAWWLDNTPYFTAEEAAGWTWRLQGMAPYAREESR